MDQRSRSNSSASGLPLAFELSGSHRQRGAMSVFKMFHQENKMPNSKLHKAIEIAVRKAISNMGVERFKQTSFFVSAGVKTGSANKKAEQ